MGKSSVEMRHRAFNVAVVGGARGGRRQLDRREATTSASKTVHRML